MVSIFLSPLFLLVLIFHIKEYFMESIISYITTGGIFMYPIVVCSFCAFVLLIERAFFYLQTASLLTNQSNKFFAILHAEGMEKAEEHLKSQRGLLKKVLLAALANRHKPVERIAEKMDLVLLNFLPIYRKHLNLLATLAGAMPILGLLGTVTGMIATFKVIALQGTGDAQAMADGISEALITTQAGLVSALPIIFGHVLLSNRLNKINGKIKAVCAQLLDFIKDKQHV